MTRTLATWVGIAGLARDALGAFVLAPLARLLQLVDDAHDTDSEGDDTDA